MSKVFQWHMCSSKRLNDAKKLNVGFKFFVAMSAKSESYQVFFERVCNNAFPPETVFEMPRNVPTYTWPEDRDKIARIRDSTDKRCAEFLLNLYGFTFRVTAGVKRKLDLKLFYPNKSYPYSYKGVKNALNYVLIGGKEEIKLNDNDVPSGKSYWSLLKGFLPSEDIRNLASIVLKVLKCKKEISFDGVSKIEKILEIAGLIITSEYFRGRQSLAIAYTELYKLKHNPTRKNLERLFIKDCTLIFPQIGGSKAIMQAKYNVLIGSFESMLDTNETNSIYQKLSKNNQEIVKQEFFKGKLEKLRYIYGETNGYAKSIFKSYTKILYDIQKLELSQSDYKLQFDTFKQLYYFVKKNNIRDEISHNLFQYFKNTLTEQPFLRFMKNTFSRIDDNVIGQQSTKTRNYLGTILEVSISSILRFMNHHCPLVEMRLREVSIDLSKIIKNLRKRKLISKLFFTTPVS